MNALLKKTIMMSICLLCTSALHAQKNTIKTFQNKSNSLVTVVIDYTDNQNEALQTEPTIIPPQTKTQIEIAASKGSIKIKRVWLSADEKTNTVDDEMTLKMRAYVIKGGPGNFTLVRK